MFSRALKPLLRRALAPSALASAATFYFNESDEPTHEKPATPIGLPPSSLSHEFLIQQSCTLSVESSSNLMSQMVNAVNDQFVTFSDVIGELASLYDDSVIALTEEGADRVALLKQAHSDLKKSMDELETAFYFVQKLMDANAEVCFIVGSEFASTQASERIYSAKKTVSEVFDKVRLMELDLVTAYTSHIDKVARAIKIQEERNKTQSENVQSEDNAEKSGDTELIIEEESDTAQ